MVSSDRPGPGHPLSPSIASSVAASAGESSRAVGREGAPVTQRAALILGACVVEVAAEPGLTALALTLDGSEARFAVHPDALAEWAEGVTQLVALPRARAPRECAVIRTPFLLDAEGRATIAVEAEVTEGEVRFALHTAAALSAPPSAAPQLAQRGAEPTTRVFAILAADARALVEAARGAAVVARDARSNPSARAGG